MQQICSFEVMPESAKNVGFGIGGRGQGAGVKGGHAVLSHVEMQ